MEKFDEFSSLVRSRHSCRQYSPRQVGRETLLAVLETARNAPSACNRQPWEFIVVDSDRELRQVIVDSYSRDWIASAPAFIVACGDHDLSWHRGSDGKDHADVDVSIAVEHVCLAAAAMGLGTCWVCNFDVPAVRAGLNLPGSIEPIALIPIGYPEETAAVPEKKRKPIEENVRWGKY